MKRIDRPGIFKAVPVSIAPRTWDKPESPSNSVSMSCQFEIIAKLEGSDWHDWTGFQEGPYTVFGEYFIIKKDGTVNQTTCDQLAESLGWNGDIDAYRSGPPQVVVQIAVNQEEYQGKAQFKAGWMRPGDYVPQPRAADEQTVKSVAVRFGSLLRAATAQKAAAAKPTPSPVSARTKVRGVDGQEVDDTPF